MKSRILLIILIELSTIAYGSSILKVKFAYIRKFWVILQMTWN